MGEETNMKLPTQINVTKLVVYEVQDIVSDIVREWDVVRKEVTLKMILERLQGWTNEDFLDGEYTYITDQDGKELPEWNKIT